MVLPNCLLFLQTYEVAFSDTRMQRGSFRGSLMGTLNILRPQANALIEVGRRRWRRKHFTAGMDCHRAEFVGTKARDQLSLPDDAVFPPALDAHGGLDRWRQFVSLSATAGPDGLLRRHDYHVDVAGGFAAAHLVSDFVEAQGLRFPTRRRAYQRGDDLSPRLDLVMVSIDVGEFSLR